MLRCAGVRGCVMGFGDARIGLSRLAPLAAGVCLAACALTFYSGEAQARRHHARWRSSHAPAASGPAEVDGSKFSAMVIDANTGREIWGVNENALPPPASITKVMTLYLLFEQLEKGTMTLETRIPVSEHAANQEPSKLGVPAGETISVEEAIKAIVTRSANDMAVAVAEAVGHDESNFAAIMTHAAHQIGMSRTLYRNASGLPNDEQLTTARDLTLLARSMQERFPKYYHYFSLHEFTYDGEVIGNHDHLLGRVDGVDGIKTGYTRASGFNLLTSVHRDGRALVAVVMGGRSSGARDRMMEQLIADHIAEASTGGHTATMIADNEPPAPNAAPWVAPPVAQGGRSMPVVAVNAPAPPARPAPELKGEGDNASDDDEDSAPRAPILPKIVARPSVTPVVASEPPRIERTVAYEPALIERPTPVDPRELGWVKGPAAAPVVAKATPIVKEQPAAKSVPAAAPPPASRSRQEARAEEPRPEESRVARVEDAHVEAKTGWVVQIGASDDAEKANDLLIRARAQNPSTLAAAKPITEKVKKGEGFLYRARFAGLDAASAEQACRSLKRSGFSCFATRD